MTVAIAQDETVTHRQHLAAAARLALRGHGGAEPNPLVGCLITASDGRRVGAGYHRLCGDAHAEIIALRQAGESARGGTCYVTLEPCNHTGRTGPCTEAIIRAGIAHVVIARRDPHPDAAGGIDRLRAAGVHVSVTEVCPEAIEVSDPFVQRVRAGVPWVIAKWAQTIDGRLATRTGDSKWISGPLSRRMVHRERGRVDAILTGIGTVLADDPLLTARDVRVRRIARRIVIDPQLRVPIESQLVRTAAQSPVTVICDTNAAVANQSRVQLLQQHGVEVIEQSQDSRGIAGDGIRRFVLRDALRMIAARHDLTTILVEAGPGLLSGLLREGLINDAWVFIGAIMLGDAAAPSALAGDAISRIREADSFALKSVRRRGDDVMLHYRASPVKEPHKA